MTLLLAMLDPRGRLHGRLARAFRIAAACLMLLGMGPSPDVIADTVNGWGDEAAVVEVADDGCCDAGCTTSGCASHHCGCCLRVAAPLPDAAAPPELRLVLVEGVALARPYHEGVGPKRAIPPPVRPPIG